jgi:hypothetical protein
MTTPTITANAADQAMDRRAPLAMTPLRGSVS